MLDPVTRKMLIRRSEWLQRMNGGGGAQQPGGARPLGGAGADR
jgi:hypothetical protein